MAQVKSDNVNLDSDSLNYNLETSRKVQSGNFYALKSYLDLHDDKNIILQSATTEDGRTPLHDVCDIENTKTATGLLNHLKIWFHHSEPTKRLQFIDKQDLTGNTAMHYAIQRRNRYAVKMLLEWEANVNLINSSNEEVIAAIYQHYPNLILTMLTARNKAKPTTTLNYFDEKDYDNENDKNTSFNFGPIVGVHVDRCKIYETFLLSNMLQIRKENQNKILSLPIVEKFLDLKWNKMKWFIYASTLLHIVWTVLTCSLIYNLFMTRHGKDIDSAEERKQFEGNSGFFCTILYPSWYMTVFVCCHILFTIILAGKSFSEAKNQNTPTTYSKLKQMWCQISVIIPLFVILLNITRQFFPVWIDYYVSMVGVLSSFFVSTNLMIKHPSLCVFNEMFMKSLVHLGLMSICILHVLMAFAFLFQMLIVTVNRNVWLSNLIVLFITMTFLI